MARVRHATATRSAGAVASPRRARSPAAGRFRPLRGALTGWEIAALTALVAWMLTPLVVLAAAGSGTFNGTYGIQVSDQFQYMAFVREAGEHVLISNRFDVIPDPHLFLHPIFLASGLLWQAGASMQLAFLVWLPVAGAALFLGYAAYVRRTLGTGPAAGAALLLGLFFFTPATPLAHWLVDDAQLHFRTLVMGLELFPAGYVWGGAAATIALALMPVFLLGVERTIDPARRAAGRGTAWYAGWTGAAGLLVSWLHPWQGIILLVMLGGLWLWARLDRRLLVLSAPAALTAAPLAYYWVLSRTDSTWSQFANTNELPHVGLWFVLGLAPAALALPGMRGRDLDAQERLLRLWPVATLAVYFGLQTGWIYQALGGVTLPLAILAVRWLRRVGLPRAVVAVAIAAVTIPGMAFLVNRLASTTEEHFFDAGEREALAMLDRAERPGPVLAPQRLGQAVPGFTGRSTWIGHYQWTPDYYARLDQTEALFEGRLAPADAQRLVTATGAAFVLTGCDTAADLAAPLGPLVAGVRRVGCAKVYEIRRS